MELNSANINELGRGPQALDVNHSTRDTLISALGDYEQRTQMLCAQTSNLENSGRINGYY